MNGYKGSGTSLKRDRQSKSLNLIIEKELLKSKAWLSITGSAPQVYMLFPLKRAWEKSGIKGNHKWVCTNEREIIFPYRKAKEDYDISEKTYLGSVTKLVEVGLPDIVKPGVAVNREATVCGISKRWKDYGTSKFIRAERPQGACGYPPRPRRIHG